MEWLTLSGIVQACMLLLHVKSVLCLDVHLLEDWNSADSDSVLVFDASNGVGWSYHIHRSSRTDPSYKLFSLDATTGSLYLQHRDTVCRHLSHNPVQLRIVASTFSHDRSSSSFTNYTITPLTFYFHNLSCYSPPVRNDFTVAGFDFLLIDLFSNEFSDWKNVRCIESGQSLLTLNQYLPSTLKNELVCDIIVEDSSFSFNLVDTSILTKSVQCLEGSEISIPVKLVLCDKTPPSEILLKINIHDTVPLGNQLSVVKASRLETRMRRQATNTAPYFEKGEYTASVPENMPAGQTVILITATDVDEGEAGKLTYRLDAMRDARSNDMFTIDPISGMVKTTQPLDRELIALHVFSVTATDSSLNQRSDDTTLNIKVLDKNDHTPTFQQPVYSVSRPENIPVATTILTVRATDGDAGDNQDILYTIINPPNPTTFMIDRKSGSISTMKVLDREVESSYRLIVQAMDQAPPESRKSSTATVEITVEDENDNFPQFDQSSYTVNISENLNITNSPVIARISATDLDEGENKQIIYSITSGNLDNTFSVNPTTGEVKVQKLLDYETHPEFRLKIKAADQGISAKSNTTTLWIRIEDLNDNAPFFQSSGYQGSVLENESIGKTVLTVHALDRDSGQNGQLQYSLLDASSSLPFAIDENTGQISVRATIDREVQSSYNFIVQVKDKGRPPLSATAAVDITVRDINDNSPIFSPKTYYVTISEDSPLYKRIIQVTANDADTGENAHLSYVFSSGNNDEVFSLGRETGIITLAKTLDYKVQNRYILSIRASDSANNYDSAEVHINVTDINKHVPAFENAPYVMNVYEGVSIGKSVGKVHALDSDVGENGRITYEIMNSVQDFEIDPNTGEITTREVLDRELQAMFSFDVKASDNAKPPLSDTASVTIMVDDKNDNKPRFTESRYEAEVSEAEIDGTFVITVHAEDIDAGVNKQVAYRFGDGSDGIGDFEVDSASGEIRVAKGSDLDREVKSNYNLTIFAVDRGVVPQTGSTEVHIRITDINDNRPEFASNPMRAYVSENKKIGSTVAVISAVDPDKGLNAVIEYSFVGGLDADKFLLNSKPGEPAIIVNYVDLDYESDKKQYEIRLKASSGSLFTSTLVIIQVVDVNDNAPVLDNFIIIFNNFVDHFPTEPIGRVPARDEDESDRDKLVYTFLTRNATEFLHLDESTGELSLNSALNSDVPRNGTIHVQVTDGLHTVSATCRLFVRLVTEEMLQHSVTVRINNMTTWDFLSPALKFFQNAIAYIMSTDPANVFIINVRNDTDVPAEILNVTLSVREKSKKIGRQTIDVFYPSEFLREQIYLQRTLLANLSTLEVLPFDDNLCLQEACGEFSECQSVLRFSVAAPFISSPSMLFRPIYPMNGYNCVCPTGFSGGQNFSYLCTVEVDLCYSNPCNNSGQCLRKEGGYTCKCYEGYTGENCEVNMSQKFDVSDCPADACKPPSRCVPRSDQGFRCEGCPDNENYNQFCELTTRSFPRGSFLMFPNIRSRYRFKIQLKFATQMRNGLLFYNGRFNELHDFIALEIVDAQVQFSFSVGSGIVKVAPYVEGGVNDGEWHQVTVDYLNMTATVSVGETCDPEISVRFGRPINYTCAARESYTPNCNTSQLNCLKMLDLTGPLQIGGLPTLPSSFQVQNTLFEGCMKDFYIDGKLLDFNRSVANNGTQAGCPNKRLSCRSAPCQHGGTCIDGWATYTCICPSRWGGKDCSQGIEAARQLKGDGYLYYSNRIIPQVNFPWYNGISFRTRRPNGTLMVIVADKAETVHIQLVNGYLTYTYTNSLNPQVFVFDALTLNDGHWHYFEIRWLENGDLIMVLDYGQRQKLQKIQSSLSQKTILHVYVGSLKYGPTTPGEDHFTGCIENVRVGNTMNSVLSGPEAYNVTQGCSSPDHCTSSPCSPNAECVTEWEGYSCKCPPGTLGPECKSICQNYNPCQNMAYCRHPQGGSYECECGQLQSGQYCEAVAKQPCPSAWWGYPVCGPCNKNCTRQNGFNPNCDSRTGECSCLDNHYRLPGTYKCLPCNCYQSGSMSLQCDNVTGQCPCKEGIVGAQCNQCESKYSEIRMDEETEKFTCKVDYQACPHIFSHGVWWDSDVVNTMVTQDCPNGAVGEATRNCSDAGYWLEPNFFNCTNRKFLEHEEMLGHLEAGKLNVSNFVAKKTMAQLANSTAETETLYGNDLNITMRLLFLILDFENQQTWLDLTSEQDSTYITNLLSVVSDILQVKYEEDLDRLSQEGTGVAQLLVHLDTYLETLLSALELNALSSPRPYSVVTDNIVLGVDTIKKDNFSGKVIPKYDNIVKLPTFDDDTHVYLPTSLLSHGQLRDFLRPDVNPPHKAYVGYIMYRYLGDLLPKRYSANVRVIPTRPMSVNSPMFTLLLRDNGKVIRHSSWEPVGMRFKQQVIENRASPQCVFWDTSAGNHGRWSTAGCQETDRFEMNGDMYVNCSCFNTTNMALLMDISDTEYEPSQPVDIEVFTFISLIVCMCCLAICFIILMCFKKLSSNTTSIHTNLVFVMFLAQLSFLVGIDRVDSALFCRLIAITLHYFYMTGFSWLFVDILHIYRMMVEIRNIDQGTMKFYYLIAYVIPGIIVSLAVGLNTEGYGNNRFCWLLMTDKFIWSLAGPIAGSVIIHVFTFILSVKVTCREKVKITDMAALRLGLFSNILLLMLWGIIWVVALLAVNYNYTALHYFHAILSLALGVFVFIVYIIANSKVRLALKKLWYRCQGKKLDLDDNIAGTRSSLYSRSALAYRNDSCEGVLNRINVGISTNSTTSRSTSKSSGGMYKGEDYLRSTSTSTSGNNGPLAHTKGLPPPYYYDPEKPDDLDPDSIQIRPKREGNDSDSDSEMSERVSLDLASSHSSDDDDDEIDVRFDWEKQLPKNKKIEEAKEQARQKKMENDIQQPFEQQQQQPHQHNPHYQQLNMHQHQYQNPFEVYGNAGNPAPTFPPKPPHNAGHWPGDPQLSNYTGSDSEFRSSEQPTLSSVQPDVTLQTPEYKGREFIISPPRRVDSLIADSNSNNANKVSLTPPPYGSPQAKPRASQSSPIQVMGSPTLSSPRGEPGVSPRGRMKVQVLTHRGSLSSDSESSHATCV